MQTYRQLLAALERARSQKQTSTQAAHLRLTKLDDRLRQILESAANLLVLKKNLEEYLH